MTSSWMLVAGFLFAAVGAFGKIAASDFSSFELAAYRSLVGVVLIGSFVIAKASKQNKPLLKEFSSSQWRDHAWRGSLGSVSLFGYFYALTHLPLATAVTLNYTSPLFLAVLSTFLLRAHFKPMLLFSICVGFCGIALLLRPTFVGTSAIAAIVGLLSGFFAASAYINVRKLGDAGEPEWRVVFYFSLISCVLGFAIHGIFYGAFHVITSTNWLNLLYMGLAATLAQLAMTRAYHAGNPLVVGSFAYSTVVFSAIIGVVFFNEILPVISVVGIGIIIAAGILAKKSEAKKTS